jgi:hypothetical protein
MFPNAEDAPACPPQGSRYQPVTLFVPAEFLLPERPIAFGLGFMFGTAVPETTVHKHCKIDFWKDEIGFAEYRLMTPPAGDFVPPE